MNEELCVALFAFTELDWLKVMQRYLQQTCCLSSRQIACYDSRTGVKTLVTDLRQSFKTIFQLLLKGVDHKFISNKTIS